MARRYLNYTPFVLDFTGAAHSGYLFHSEMTVMSFHTLQSHRNHRQQWIK